MTIACSWIFGIVITFPMFLSRNFDKENDWCVYTWSEEWMGKAYSMVWFLFTGFFPVTSWSLYTPKSCTLCGSHVQSQEDVIIVCNRFETKTKTKCYIPIIYSCKKKFSLILAMQKFLYWSILFGQDSWILATVFYEFLGTLRYSGHGRGGCQPEGKCSVLGTNYRIYSNKRPTSN